MLIDDTRTAALVGHDLSIDWLSHTSLIRGAMTVSGYGDDLAGRPHSGM